MDKIDYIPDFLTNQKPDNCFLIDVLPMIVTKKEGYKFEQLENWLYNKNIYVKFTSLVKKLWLYDDLYFHSDLLNAGKTRRKIPILRYKYFMKLRRVNEINNYRHIEFLNQLSRKDIIDLEYYFLKRQIYLTPTFNGVFVFINNLKEYSLVNDIVKSEGLFLRKA